MKHDSGCGHDHDHDHDHDHGHTNDHDHDHDHDHGHTHGHEHDDSPLYRSLASQEFLEQTEAYSGRGVQFRYPSNWSIQEESGPEQTTITVQSPGTAFWTLSLFEGQPDPEHIVNSVMAAFQEMYDELDVYESDVLVLGAPAVARELDFVCLDLVSSASLIAFQSLQHTVLVMFQGEDRELESSRPLLESITGSLQFDLQE